MRVHKAPRQVKKQVLSSEFAKIIKDPFKFLALGWPNVRIYDKQAEIIESVRDNDETLVPAGNMLGKDFIAGFIAIWFFLAHEEVRVITTSIKDDHLRVLWGEIGRYLQTCRFPLTTKEGGPLKVNHRDIRKIVNGKECKISYLLGMVSEKGEGLAGHHAKYTLCIGDEASGIDQISYTQQGTWAKRFLGIGNPNPCSNFFINNTEAGDVYNEDKTRCYRKVIRIRAEDSPNIRFARALIAQGKKVPEEPFIPGVIDWWEYQKRRQTWDPIRQCIGLDAEFYKGAEILLYPPDRLNDAEEYARLLQGRPRVAEAMGIDTAEGRDSTVWTIVDRFGIIMQISMKTQDTSFFVPKTIALIRDYKLNPENVGFDRGGGGKQHADRLRELGYDVRTIGFGEAASAETEDSTDKSFQYRSKEQKVREAEEKYAYKNRRAEMYGILQKLLDKQHYPGGFGIPGEYSELRRQLAPIPLLYDEKGTMYMLPKDKRSVESKEKTLKELLGCSPDEADSLVLAVFIMRNPSRTRTVGAI